MPSYEDLQKLKGAPFIRYRDIEQDDMWKFMVRVSQELLEENRQLREQIADIKDEKCKTTKD